MCSLPPVFCGQTLNILNSLCLRNHLSLLLSSFSHTHSIPRLTPSHVYTLMPCVSWNTEETVTYTESYSRDFMKIHTPVSCFCLFCPLSSSSGCSNDGEGVASAEESQLCDEYRSAILDGTRQKEISGLERHAPDHKIDWQPADEGCPLH